MLPWVGFRTALAALQRTSDLPGEVASWLRVADSSALVEGIEALTAGLVGADPVGFLPTEFGSGASFQLSLDDDTRVLLRLHGPDRAPVRAASEFAALLHQRGAAVPLLFGPPQTVAGGVVSLEEWVDLRGLALVGPELGDAFVRFGHECSALDASGLPALLPPAIHWAAHQDDDADGTKAELCELWTMAERRLCPAPELRAGHGDPSPRTLRLELGQPLILGWHALARGAQGDFIGLLAARLAADGRRKEWRAPTPDQSDALIADVAQQSRAPLSDDERKHIGAVRTLDLIQTALLSGADHRSPQTEPILRYGERYLVVRG